LHLNGVGPGINDTALEDKASSAVLGVTPKKDKRYRVMMRFWLDANNPTDRALGQWLERLKKQRQYTATIRQALRLYRDLQRGRLEVMRELFPEFWEDGDDTGFR
jgi:hypothetical protein